MKHAQGSFEKMLRAALLPLALILTSVPAVAGPTGWGGGSCREVTGFPANLSEPGVYCLSFKYIDFPLNAGALITISADNVVLDMNGATIDGTPKGTPTSPTWGILSARNNTNITVRNGTVKGFNYGILLQGSLGSTSSVRRSHSYLIENMRFIGNRSIGIHLIGDDSEIRDTYVAHTGGFPDATLAPSAWGMFVAGSGLRLLNNDVAYTHVNTNGTGGVTYGMYLGGVREGVAVNNRITEATYGIFGTLPDWGKYRDNVTVKVDFPYTAGIDIGNNN
jgi:hypothetical protein